MAIYHRDEFCCAYCGKGSEKEEVLLTLDHIKACHKGGTNEVTNLVTCCVSCNSSKQTLTMKAWLQILETRGVDVALVRRRIRRNVRRNLLKRS